jgi:hypothetical protein
MNRAEFLQTGGFPVDLNTLDFIQNSYTDLQKIAFLAGGDKPCILTGCLTTGSTVSAGWVIVEGELLPFKTQTLGTNVSVVEEVDYLTFEEGDLKPAYKRRKVEFSVSGTIPWSDFVRVDSLLKIQKRISSTFKKSCAGNINSTGCTDVIVYCNAIRSGEKVDLHIYIVAQSQTNLTKSIRFEVPDEYKIQSGFGSFTYNNNVMPTGLFANLDVIINPNYFLFRDETGSVSPGQNMIVFGTITGVALN